jgi:tetratricopeptide (TPR) repeat protein
MRNLYFILSVIILFSVVNAQNNQTISEKELRSPQFITDESSLPPDIIDLNNEAVKKGLRGNYREAIADFRQILAQFPNIYQIRYNLARGLIEIGDYDPAIEILNNLTKNNPKHADTISSIGEVYSYKRMFAESIPYFYRSLELDPLDAVTNNNLGYAFFAVNKFSESLKYLNIALKIKPDYVAAYNNRGATFYSMGKLKEAIADFKKTVSLNPQFPEGYNNLGVTLGQKGKSEEAHKAFLEAVRLRPNWSNALYNLALSYIERGERDQARTQLDTLSNYDLGLAEKGRQVLWQKYVVKANSFQEN